jgi:hypothetical protein
MIFAAFSLNAQVTIWEEGFESFDDFFIGVPNGDFNGWTSIDNDGDATYGSSTYDFENEAYTGTAIIFNPTGALDGGGVDATGTAWDVRTGTRGLYMVASTGDVSETPLNDDFIITPQIDLAGATGSSITFYAKSLTDAFGLERFEVLLSTTGTAEGDFTVDLGGGELQAPIDWTEYTYDLTAYDGEQVYIAIHYQAQDSFVLQMDDFEVSADDVLSVEDNVLESVEHSVTANELILRAGFPIQSVQLYNVLGQEVVNTQPDTRTANISISALNQGVYIARVSIEGQTKSFKIVKR